MLDSGIKLKPLPVRAQSLNHWTSRDFSRFFFVVYDNVQKFSWIGNNRQFNWWAEGFVWLIRFLKWQYAIINAVRWNFFNKWETLWGKLGLFSDPWCPLVFIEPWASAPCFLLLFTTKPQVDISLFKSVSLSLSICLFFFNSCLVWFWLFWRWK